MTLSPDRKNTQWRNLTLFLTAFGGTCVYEEGDLGLLTTVIQAQYLPDSMRVPQDSAVGGNFPNGSDGPACG
jgi:hypothetical protein